MENETIWNWVTDVFEVVDPEIAIGATFLRFVRGALFVGLLIVVVGIVSVLLWPVIFVALWPEIQTWVVSPRGHILATILLTVVGVLLFIVRERLRHVYGFVEIGVGITGIWFSLANRSAALPQLTLQLTASVYIIVRGLDNVAQRFKKRSGDQSGSL